MRNRYYDPATGRFTQEDPIGLAGGLNVYGFAEGNPVTYSDPYGLCPGIPGTDWWDISDCPPGYFTAIGAAGGGGAGAVLGGVSGGLACSPSGPVALACVGGGALAGGKAGALAGAFVGSALDTGIWLSNRMGGGEGEGQRARKIRKTGQSGRDAADDVPSWTQGERPFVGENGNDFATRLLNQKYGVGNWRKGAGSEFNKIRKYGDRAFTDPPSL